MRPTVRSALWSTLVLAWLATATVPVGAHGSGAALPGHGLGFGVVVGLTVGLGVLVGTVVLRRYRSRTGHPSVLWLGLSLVALGCWAAVVAVVRGPALAMLVATLGAVVAWSFRDFSVVGHRGCDQATLGAVVLHRFVEGTLLAALYSADTVVGVGAALVLAVHAAAETAAVAGLWSTGPWRWGVVAVVQAGFVAGAFGGGVLAGYVTPSASVAVLAFLGGALIATGIATTSPRQHGIHA